MRDVLRRGSMVTVLLCSVVWCAGSASGQTETPADSFGDMGIHAADPSVIRTDDGFVAVESRGGRSLFVRVAPTLDGLSTARSTRIWSDSEGMGDVWAPEIVVRNGRYEVYFAAGAGSAHRMYVISSSAPDADFAEAEQVVLPDDKWAIDGLPLTFEGVDYFVWSGWQGDTDIQQDLFIAPIGGDGQVQSPRVMISSPDLAWENIGGETPTINEAPQPIVDPGGQLHVVYSANGSWGENYCLADLRLREGGDPLEPGHWFKSDGCLFGANPDTLAADATLANRAKGVGHHSFALTDGDVGQHVAWGGVLPVLYHGVPADEEPSNFWAARKWYLGAFEWVPETAYGSSGSRDTGFGIKFIE